MISLLIPYLNLPIGNMIIVIASVIGIVMPFVFGVIGIFKPEIFENETK